MAVIVEGEVVWPPIVRLPRGIGALKNEVRLTVVANDKDDVALQAFALGCQFPKIDSAQPVLGNCQRRACVPAAVPDSIRPEGRLGLDRAFERSQVLNVTPASSP